MGYTGVLKFLETQDYEVQGTVSVPNPAAQKKQGIRIWPAFLGQKIQNEPDCIDVPVTKITKIKMAKMPFAKFQENVQKDIASMKNGVKQDSPDGQATLNKIDNIGNVAGQVLKVLVELEKAGCKVWDSVLEGEAGEALSKLSTKLSEKLKNGEVEGDAKAILMDFLSTVTDVAMKQMWDTNKKLNEEQSQQVQVNDKETNSKSAQARMGYDNNAVDEYLYGGGHYAYNGDQYHPHQHQQQLVGYGYDDVYHGHNNMDAEVLQMVSISVLFVVFCVCGVLFVCTGMVFGIFAGRKAAEMSREREEYEKVGVDDMRI